MCNPATGSIFYRDTNKRCAKDIAFSSLESQLKIKSLKYKKNDKLLFEISIWIKNGKLKFFQRTCVHATGNNFFMG